jgi:hypothetical protein
MPMKARAALQELEAAEERYLAAHGWTRWRGTGLWIDPQNPDRTHIERVAAYKQRQRDTAASNRGE